MLVLTNVTTAVRTVMAVLANISTYGVLSSTGTQQLILAAWLVLRRFTLCIFAEHHPVLRCL